LIGNVLGNYRITQKIGQGGVGDVWKAIDHRSTAKLALLQPNLCGRKRGAFPRKPTRQSSAANIAAIPTYSDHTRSS
jgi:serine/threonine protein kinase